MFLFNYTMTSGKALILKIDSERNEYFKHFLNNKDIKTFLHFKENNDLFLINHVSQFLFNPDEYIDF